MTESVRPDHIPLICRNELRTIILRNRYIEMVEPEIGHHFLQLIAAIGSPQHLLTKKLPEQILFRLQTLFLHIIPDGLTIGRPIRFD